MGRISWRQGRIVVRRPAVVVGVLAGLCFAASPAEGASPVHGLGGPPSVSTVSFNNGAGLSNATCQFVPAGTTISWTGPETASTIVRTDASGVTTVSVVSHASGKATDNNGNTFAFDYSNAFRVSNSVGTVISADTTLTIVGIAFTPVVLSP